MSKIGRILNNNQKLQINNMYNQRPQGIAPNILPGVKVDDLVSVKCNNCGGEHFHPSHALKIASRFQSVNSTPTIVQLPLGFACSGCGEVNPFNPDQLLAAKDGQKEKQNKEENTEAPTSLGISVDDGIKTKEKLS